MKATANLFERTTILLLLGAGALGAGCADDPRIPSMNAGSADAADAADAAAGRGPAADAGVETPAPDGPGGGDAQADAPTLGPPSRFGLAVVGSDFMSTSISLVDVNGVLVRDDCINSGTGAGGQLSFTLSGDVTLPSQPQRGNELWLIDRGANAALTVVDPATCAVRRQLSVGAGLNPHDVVVLSAAKAYVSRFERKPLAVSPNGRGDDLLIIDPQSGAIAGRIDLGPYAAPVAGTQIQARPDRAVIADGRVFVTLGSQNATFSATGEARLVVIDPATDRVTGAVALTGLKGCSALEVLPGGKTLYVACGGSFADVDQALESGVALVDLSVDPPAVSRVISSVAFNARPVNFSWVAVLGPGQAFAGTLGAFADAASQTAAVSDALFAFDPTTGRSAAIGLGAAYDLGRAAAGGGRLFVPDAAFGAPRLHVLATPSGAAATETAAFDPEPAHHLPPREIAWY